MRFNSNTDVIEWLANGIDLLAHEVPPLDLAIATERSFVARLAIRLHELTAMQTVLIDVEYGATLDKTGKTLPVSDELALRASALNRTIYEREDSDQRFVRVVPDLLVHQRGTHTNNELVLEAKFSEGGAHAKAELEYAKAKLVAFMNPTFNYRFGVLLVIPRNWADLVRDAQSAREGRCVDLFWFAVPRIG